MFHNTYLHTSCFVHNTNIYNLENMLLRILLTLRIRIGIESIKRDQTMDVAFIYKNLQKYSKLYDL